MNNFTKEELKELLNGYQMHSYNNRHNWPSLDLCKKLQSMIDNYEKDKQIKESMNYIIKKAREWRMEL